MIKDLPETARLMQLAEECSELAQAALNLGRAIGNENPTPIGAGEARAKVMEEAADVMVCLDALVRPEDMQELNRMMDAKRRRWTERLEGSA